MEYKIKLGPIEIWCASLEALEAALNSQSVKQVIPVEFVSGETVRVSGGEQRRRENIQLYWNTVKQRAKEEGIPEPEVRKRMREEAKYAKEHKISRDEAKLVLDEARAAKKKKNSH
jgi:hypothetical protein